MGAVGPNRFVDMLVQLNLEYPKTTTQKLVIGNNRALGSVELEALRKAVQHHNIARLEFGGFGGARFGLEGFVDLDRGARVPRNRGGGAGSGSSATSWAIITSNAASAGSSTRAATTRLAL